MGINKEEPHMRRKHWFGRITAAALVLLTILGGTITATIPGISRPTTTSVTADSDDATATHLASLTTGQELPLSSRLTGENPPYHSATGTLTMLTTAALTG